MINMAQIVVSYVGWHLRDQQFAWMLDIGINWFTADLYNRVIKFNRLSLTNQEKTSLPPDMCNIPALVIK